MLFLFSNRLLLHLKHQIYTLLLIQQITKSVFLQYFLFFFLNKKKSIRLNEKKNYEQSSLNDDIELLLFDRVELELITGDFA